MPLKTWADFERLEAPDLNAAFSWSQDRTVVGAWSSTAGADVGSIVSGAYKTLPLGAPPAGQDPLGIWQSDGRLLVPAGWGGIWTFIVAGNVNLVTAGAGGRVFVTGMGTGARMPIGGSTDAIASTSTYGLSWTAPAIAGAYIYPELSPQNSDSSSGAVYGWSLMRMGRGLGIPGAVALGMLASGLEALTPDDIAPLPAPEGTD